MMKTTDWTDVQKKVIDTLRKEEMFQKDILKEDGCS